MHKVVDGDTINIPAGSCTWTSAITVPNGVGISIIGAGFSSTTITDNVSGAYMFLMKPQYGNSTSRISSMTLQPQSGASPRAPIAIIGTCTSSGCPSIRIDNNVFPSSWCSASYCPSDASTVIADNVFGVLDHNTIGTSGTPTAGNGIDFVNVNHSGWQGSADYGDNSWYSANTFGSAQALYLENNTFYYSFGTDTDGGDSYGDTGGGRLVCRFNTFNNMPQVSACGGHGTETTGRPRGLRQAEFYGNTVNSTNTSATGLGMRSGIGYMFGNTFTNSGGSYPYWMSLNNYRTFRPTDWTLCDGVGPYDVNDGGTQVWSGTVSSFSGSTLSVSGSPWTSGAYNFSAHSPGSNYYVVFNTTHGNLAGIASNTTNSLTVSWMLSNLAGTFYGGTTFANGDRIVILSSTLYAAGAYTGTTGQNVLTDSTKSWTTNQWAGYSMLDVSNGYAGQIVSNTATTATFNVVPIQYANGTSWGGWTNGDSYLIARATRCLDQSSSYGGTFFNGAEVLSPEPMTQTLSPSYEFADMAGTGGTPTNLVYADSLNVQANRDYYYTNSSFNGTSGTGSGTLSGRPSTCTTGVAYWATDQGNWNLSGNGFGQGQLYICTGTNSWTPSYTPYTYPHPGTQGTGTTTNAPTPPTNLASVSR
jgi:hypothetical protein